MIGNPLLTTKVNGEVRQDDNTSDMVWNIKQIFVHLTRGRKVRAGAVAVTGTPLWVGWFTQPSGSGFVKDGEVVEITIEKLGTIRNRFHHLERYFTI